MDVYKCSGCQTAKSAGVRKIILSPGSLQAGTGVLEKNKPSVMISGFRPLLSIPEHH